MQLSFPRMLGGHHGADKDLGTFKFLKLPHLTNRKLFPVKCRFLPKLQICSLLSSGTGLRFSHVRQVFSTVCRAAGEGCWIMPLAEPRRWVLRSESKQHSAEVSGSRATGTGLAESYLCQATALLRLALRVSSWNSRGFDQSLISQVSRLLLLWLTFCCF